MKRRLVVLTEIIAPYRIPVFNALAKQNAIDLHVIFLSETDPTLRQWHVYKDEIQFSYEVLPSWRRRLGKHHLLLNRDMAPALDRAAPDTILCGGYSYLASWQSLYWARRRGVLFLSWVESTLCDHRSRHALVESAKERFIRNCDGFVVPGKSSLEYLQSYGVPEGRVFTAPNAVDSGFFHAQSQSARMDGARLREELHLPERFFLFVGRLVQEKGVFDLLEAYRLLPPQIRQEVGLVFAGDGPARAELECCVDAIRGQVHFAGFVHREQLGRYYGLAESFVFPTHTDTWGLAVNEAMACGLPVIVSRAAGCAADLVRDGEEERNGLLVNPGDTRQLAVAMEQVASGFSLRQQMGQAGARRILQFSPEACAAGMANALFSCGALACA